ncbi:alpha/beta fold hydrolase [Pseudoalteromonas fenneropenaei]|uniref:Alpha/beta fold hydrolase n=1 Tax=Pseudoalteromonas fenneropenaei TaxID=1737459 RepID=A0ABV7CG20_9GAMM
MKNLLSVSAMLACFSASIAAAKAQPLPSELTDATRQRAIPVVIQLPVQTSCSKAAPCRVAILGSGYGIAHNEYQFITTVLNQRGYLTIAIQHELPEDPPLSRSMPFSETRLENWQRGVDSVEFVRATLAAQLSHFNFNELTLLGHSNGGDIAALYAQQYPQQVKQVVTFDSRRVPMPRSLGVAVLTLRASDYPADEGVLPNTEETAQFPICVSLIPDSKHNDMYDGGPEWLKTAMQNRLSHYLDGVSCDKLVLQ